MAAPAPPRLPGRTVEVFRAFLGLGCRSFGGPIAHLGYFREEFVARRGWIDDARLADFVALCQFLPGPTSSQVGIAIGCGRAGKIGGFAAWAGFTIPSAILMLAFAWGVRSAGQLAHAGWVHGLKVAAVAVVAQAVRQMAVRLCPDAPRVAIASAAAVALLFAPGPWMQIAVLAGGALAGAAWGRWFRLEKRAGPESSAGYPPQRTGSSLAWLAAFAALLMILPAFERTAAPTAAGVFNAFYRTGSLVFGGGHVVLPLLEQATVGRGWLDRDSFLAGYGLAQALPGPLFTFSAYLGALIPPGGIPGGLLALSAIYLPTFLLLFGTLPHLERLRSAPRLRLLLSGVNASVVGLLAAAFCTPIWTSAITSVGRMCLMLAAFLGLELGGWRPWVVVLGCAAAGAAFLG